MRMRFGRQGGSCTNETRVPRPGALLLVSVVAAMLVLAACSSNSGRNNAASTVTAPPASSATALRSTAATGTPSTGSAPVSAAPTVQLRPRAGGTALLTNPAGKTLYVFDRDAPGMSACTDACTSTWPPLILTTGAPVPPAGLAGTLSSLKRGDGAEQVALNGRPLYTYAGDSQPGDTRGDGVGGVWHVAGAAPSTPTPASAPRSYPGY